MNRFKVECITTESENLTFGKEYKVIKSWKEKSDVKPYEHYSVYLVVDDTGYESVEPCCLFKKIEKFNKENNQNKEFNWYKFKKCKVAVNCKTIEEAKDFLNKCDKYYFNTLALSNSWWFFGRSTCLLCENKSTKITLASIRECKELNYKILDWSDYMNNENYQNKYDIEKTFKEVNNDIQDGETWENDIFKISKINNGIRIWRKDNIKCNGFGILDDMKFKLQRNKFNFSDAFTEYENNNLEIESIVTGRKFKKMIIGDMLNDCIIYKEIKEFNNRNDGFALEEIRGEWYINK